MKLYDFNSVEEKLAFINRKAVEDKYGKVVDLKTLNGYVILDREYFQLFDQGHIFHLLDAVLEDILDRTIESYEDGDC